MRKWFSKNVLSAEYGRILPCTKWKEQAKLAYKIAMLPERKYENVQN